ncbi:MAG: flagellar hook-associated protein FlgL [Sulfuricellaceae bacterium]|nr:flagellar hook-associated protein FlgL [Sulfuricellaceae bacterium]
MRVSTSMIYDTNVAAMQDQTSNLLKVNQQIATGRRILTPSDDPVAAAQALGVGQSITTNDQHQTNQKTALSSLSLEESNLSSAQDLIQHIRDLAVSAGNAAYDNQNRGAIATEIRSSMKELLSIANTDDGKGNFMFSGFQAASAPFSVVPSGASAPVAYNGDQGQRLLQIEPARQVAISDPGSSVFMNVKSGNGSFVTSAPLSNSNPPGQVTSTNTGTGIIDGGNVLDQTKWAGVTPVVPVTGTGNINDRFSIVFAVDNTGVTPVTTYDIVANIDVKLNSPAGSGQTIAAGQSLITGAASATTNSTLTPAGPRLPRIYTPGQSISLQKLSTDGAAVPSNGQPAFSVAAAWDTGTAVSIDGTPASTLNGALPAPGTAAFAAASDNFTIKASSNESVFKTIDDLATLLETGVTNSATTGNADRAKLTNGLNTALTNLSNDLDRISTVRASVGSRLKEIDASQSLSADLGLQYQTNLSGLQDLDYTKAITSLNQNQVGLDAAQKAFVKVSGLSLFSYL